MNMIKQQIVMAEKGVTGRGNKTVKRKKCCGKKITQLYTKEDLIKRK